MVSNANSESSGAAVRGLVFFEICCCLCTLFQCVTEQTVSLSTPCVTIQGEAHIKCRNIPDTSGYVSGNVVVSTSARLWLRLNKSWCEVSHRNKTDRGAANVWVSPHPGCQRS